MSDATAAAQGSDRRMRFTAQFPLDHIGHLGALATAEHVAGYALAAERAGFHAIAFTEHPAPSREWLTSSAGHASFDPFPALGFCAAATSTLRLMPYLAVAPYRHPFLLAKAAQTVDILSGGRLILALGSGYLEAEFDALGVRFADRPALLDESLEVVRASWSGEPVRLSGTRWNAVDHQLLPRAPTQPTPPIWIGGNSTAVLRRVARVAEGWTPLMIAPDKSAPWVRNRLETPAALQRAVRQLRELMDEAGRGEEPLEVQIKAPASRIKLADFDHSRQLEQLAELRDASASFFVVHPMDTEPEAIRELLVRYGEQVIAALA